jgi:hypothetical protein
MESGLARAVEPVAVILDQLSVWFAFGIVQFAQRHTNDLSLFVISSPICWHLARTLAIPQTLRKPSLGCPHPTLNCPFLDAQNLARN